MDIPVGQENEYRRFIDINICTANVFLVQTRESFEYRYDHLSTLKKSQPTPLTI